MGGTAPSVVLADDHPALREGIRLRLELDGVGVVVAEAEDGVEALAAVRTHYPQVAVLDVNMPLLDGVSITRQLRLEDSPTRVILYTAVTDPVIIQHALAAGAHGFVDKLSSLDVLIAAIDATIAGERFVDPRLIANLLTDDDHLSPRELQVLQLAADGMQNKAIALRLGVGDETVKSHLSNVMRKLHADSRTGAVATGLRRSLIS